VSSDFPGGMPNGSGQNPELTPVISGPVPSLADCFTPRPQTGPGPLDASPPGQRLVLTAPPGAVKPADGWPDGTGKTQLAAHLARTWCKGRESGLLVWLTATSRDSMLSGYAQAARRIEAVPADDPEAAAARLLSRLAETSQPWLVVLDRLSGPADLDGLWPDGPAGRVLVTTSDDAAVPGTRDRQVFPVGMFSPHEALTYLTARLSSDPDQRLGAVDLVQALDCDPLAMAQASAAIARSGVSCRGYQDMFGRRREQIAEAIGAQPAAKAVTWTLSLECADEFSPGGFPQLCLALAALLGCQGIPETVFSARAVVEFIAGPAGNGGAADPDRVRSALLSLHDTGLLSIEAVSATRMVRVHPVVRAAVMSAMPDALMERAAKAAADALLQVWPEGAWGSEGTGDGEQSPLACALRACVASLEQAAAEVLWATGSHGVLIRAGQSLDAARLTRPAVNHWRAVAQTSERLLGLANPDTLLAASRLAGAALAAGLGADAVRVYQRVLDTQEGHLGADHPRTAAARADLGTALLTAGQPGEAITVLEGVLAAERDAGSGGVDAVSVQDSLVAAYQAAGQHKEAIGLAERTLAERERDQGPDHPETMLTRRTLARACLAAGRTKDAIAHGRRALAGAERVLGPDHPDTIDAVSALASAHHSARRLKDAIPLYERALGGRERLAGPDSPDTIGIRGNLASAYHSSGRMASALELYERTRADCQRVLGADHPDTLAARANLAHAYYAMGRMTEADALLRRTLADCERVLAPGDPLTAAVRDSLDAVSGG
jgi:tetratricopeptide (TPR) repeat protein